MAVKPGTPHPTRKGMVMGKNGRYVAKSTYNKQVKAAKTSNTGNPQTPPSKGGALVKQGSSAITKPSNKGGGRAKTGGSQKALPGSNPKALPPGKPGGALKISGGGAASRALGALGIVGGTAAEIQKMRDRAARDAERNKKLNRRPFEELRADSRTRSSGSSTRTGQGSRKPTAPKPTDKQIAALTQKGGIFYQGDSKPKAEKPQPARQNVTPSKPRVKAQTKPPAGKKPAKPQTSGVGPVASGRTYSVQKTGKSVMQQQADELRAMRKGSQERQAADKKKLEASKKKLEASKKKRKYGR